jgi:hypothetical protein
MGTLNGSCISSRSTEAYACTNSFQSGNRNKQTTLETARQQIPFKKERYASSTHEKVAITTLLFSHSYYFVSPFP